jgi:hypothetical protein
MSYVGSFGLSCGCSTITSVSNNKPEDVIRGFVKHFSGQAFNPPPLLRELACMLANRRRAVLSSPLPRRTATQHTSWLTTSRSMA